jgi:hypothetical protein
MGARIASGTIKSLALAALGRGGMRKTGVTETR